MSAVTVSLVGQDREEVLGALVEKVAGKKQAELAMAAYRRGQVRFDYAGDTPVHLVLDDPNMLRVDLFNQEHERLFGGGLAQRILAGEKVRRAPTEAEVAERRARRAAEKAEPAAEEKPKASKPKASKKKVRKSK